MAKKNISSTFSVNTLDDPVSVVAQYSPDKSQVHSTWQEGDIWMRTRSTDSSWSPWFRIVGESGEETDYTFNISKNKTSTNATTPPADCYYSTWQDAPVVPTTDYPYMWMKMQRKNGDGTNQGSATYTRLTGEKGEDAVVASATPDKISIPCNTDGSVTSQVTQGVTLSLKVGNTGATVNGNTSWGALPTGVTVTKVANGAYTITIGTSATATGLAAGIVFTVHGTLSGSATEYSANVTIALIGAVKGATGQGSQGKMGRFLWYAGLWSEVADQSFTVDDYKAPYVNIGTNDSPNCKAWVGSNGSYTFPTSPSGYTNSSDWESMTTDFKYLITQAMFSKYAHMGAFIINEDWMISQYGMLVDSSGTETVAGSPIILYGNNIHNGTIIVRVQFTSSGTVSVIATASSESGYDKGSVRTSSGSILAEVSGTQSATVSQSVSSGGYIDLYYVKDGSQSSYDDKITFEISGVTYTVSQVSATTGMTYTGSSSIVASPYTYFDPTDPMVNTKPSSGYKFRPNFAVDGKTGKTYQNDAYIRGTINASKYYNAKQYIEIPNSSYSGTTKDIDEGVQVVEVQSSSSVDATNKVRLPDASTNAGMTVDIYSVRRIVVVGYNIVPFTVIAKSGDIVDIRYSMSQTGFPTLREGQHIKVYCNGSAWVVLEGLDVISNNIATTKIESDEYYGHKELDGNYLPVALPGNIRTSSFTLPESPTNGMMIFCKGISAALTVTTKSHAIMSRNSNNNWCEANSSATIADRDSVILVFSSAASKWLYFSCD